MDTRHEDGESAASARAQALHREAIVIDGQGVALLLPVVLIPPAPLDGKTFLERAAASGVTAMNTTLGLGGIATGPDDLRGASGKASSGSSSECKGWRPRSTTT